MMKPALKEQKAKSEEVIRKLEEHTDNWIDKMEQIFDFATYARHWFEHGTVEQQRSILQELGSNIFLHDKKVWVDQLKPSIALKELKNSEEYEKITFELKEKSLESVKKDNHLSDYPTLRARLDTIRTFLGDTFDQLIFPRLPAPAYQIC